MTVIEWVSGARVMTDISIIVTLLIYMWMHRAEMGNPPYCIATGLVVMVFGNTVSNAWIWLALLEHHELDTQEKIAAVYPLVGSQAWVWGSVICLFGLFKLVREFTTAYIDPCGHCWIIAVVLAMLIPLISIWV